MTRVRWRHRDTVLSLCVLAYFGVRFVEYALSLVFADVEATLGVSTFVVGLAVAASTVTYAAAQLPSGALGDRYGERTVVLAALGLTGVASLLLALSPSGLFVILGMALLGLVSGAYYSPATALLSDLFEETGRAIGVHRLGAQFVGFTGPLVGVVAARYGWRAVLALAGVVVVPVLLGFRLLVRPRRPVRPETPIRERITPEAAADLLSRPPIAFTTGVAAFAQFVDTATFSFLPLLLRQYHGVSVELAGVLFTAYFGAVTASQPFAGWASDRLGPDPVTVVALSVGVAGYLLLLVRGGVATVAAAVLLVGCGMGWGPPVQSRFVTHLDDAERGIGFGLVRSAYIGFAALNGVVVGGIVTLSGWKAAIWVLVVALAVPAAALGANRATGRWT
ncbi:MULTISPECIES: MFS transporter [Halorussus]|uniref:MFS transporter n=1 Tax=Halorussus TaxID=1070314 RepID=UPI0020A03CEF|nr:MFS transporter [Halorussus vallis]USZ74224.1 MFS transporter [Halorussus vallis]